MSVAKVVEISSTSKKGFEEAIEKGISRTCETVKNVKGAWVKEQKVKIENGKVVEYCVNMQVTFILE